MVTVAEIKGYKLFYGLDESELNEIAKLCIKHTYEANEVITVMNSPAKDLYILVDGNNALQIEVPISSHRPKVAIQTLGKGEAFGWAAIVPPHLRTASARMIDRAEVICIDGQKLRVLLENDNHIGYILMRNVSMLISSRLSYTTVALRDQLERLAPSFR